MPIFKDFAENGKLLNIHYEELNPKNLVHYIRLNGNEQTKGYIQGLDDLLLELTYGGYSGELVDGEVKSRYTLKTVGSKIKLFTEKKKLFLKDAEKIVLDVASEFPDGQYNQFKVTPLSPLSSETIPSFIKENGIKATKGYLDCVADFVIVFEETFKSNSNYNIGRFADAREYERNQFSMRAQTILKNYLLK